MALTAAELSALKSEKYHIALDDVAHRTYTQCTDNLTDTTLFYLSYADNLAKAMQVRMAAGWNFKDIIQKTTLDVHDIAECPLSDEEFHRACEFLVQTWKHGPELNEWHKETFPPWNRLLPNPYVVH